MKIKKAVIPAAGYGTRFLPITKSVPKEMLNVGVFPAIHYIVEEAVLSGIEDILIIVSKGKESIKKYFDKNILYESEVAKRNLQPLNNLLERASFTFINQDTLNGTGGAILLTEDFTNKEPFVVMFGDDVTYNPLNPVAKQLIEAFYQVGHTILGAQHRPKEEAIKYGVVEGETKGKYTKITKLLEKPKLESLKSTLCSLGRFVLTNDIYDLIKKSKSHNGEIYLTDALSELIKAQKITAYEFDGRRFDLGDKFGFLEANIELGLIEYGDKLKAFLNNLIF